jgi:hypothetical protein
MCLQTPAQQVWNGIVTRSAEGLAPGDGGAPEYELAHPVAAGEDGPELGRELLLARAPDIVLGEGLPGGRRGELCVGENCRGIPALEYRDLCSASDTTWRTSTITSSSWRERSRCSSRTRSACSASPNFGCTSAVLVPL